MLYRLLADITISVHFLWILFLIFGAIWGRRYRWVKVFHIAGLGFAFVINVFGFACPLTDLEVWLQSKYAPGTAYTGSFIAHYLERIIYLDVPLYLIAMLTVLLCAFNAWVYLRRRRAPTTPSSS